jgi:hypothetical protein
VDKIGASTFRALFIYSTGNIFFLRNCSPLGNFSGENSVSNVIRLPFRVQNRPSGPAVVTLRL